MIHLPLALCAGPLASIRIASSMTPTRALCCPAFVATLRDCRASGIHKNHKFHVFRACFMASGVCYVPFVCLQAPPGIHKNREFLVSHAFVAPLGFASSTSFARVLWCPASVVTPRICEFHICCARVLWCPASVATPRICEFHICFARLGVPSVCCDPSDLRVPLELHG